jgi:hypothetical protein
LHSLSALPLGTIFLFLHLPVSLLDEYYVVSPMSTHLLTQFFFPLLRDFFARLHNTLYLIQQIISWYVLFIYSYFMKLIILVLFPVLSRTSITMTAVPGTVLADRACPLLCSESLLSLALFPRPLTKFALSSAGGESLLSFAAPFDARGPSSPSILQLVSRCSLWHGFKLADQAPLSS